MVIPVTTQHFPMLQRNLLYTGDPRAAVGGAGVRPEAVVIAVKGGGRSSGVADLAGGARLDLPIRLRYRRSAVPRRSSFSTAKAKALAGGMSGVWVELAARRCCPVHRPARADIAEQMRSRSNKSLAPHLHSPAGTSGRIAYRAESRDAAARPAPRPLLVPPSPPWPTPKFEIPRGCSKPWSSNAIPYDAMSVAGKKSLP